jgi:hypothetical protein
MKANQKSVRGGLPNLFEQARGGCFVVVYADGRMERYGQGAPL